MADSLRYGFKAEAERRSLSLRARMGLSAHDRLDPLKLADELRIPVLTLTDLQGDVHSEGSIKRMLSSRSGFSAVTVCAGKKRLIVYNPQQPPGRQANSLAHELSHVLLEHRPSAALGPWGCRDWDEAQESEADWQAAALLVPRDGALWWIERGGALTEGSEHFGVSEPLFRWRVNQTGVLRQVTSRRRRQPSFSEFVRQATEQFGRTSTGGSRPPRPRRPLPAESLSDRRKLSRD